MDIQYNLIRKVEIIYKRKEKRGGGGRAAWMWWCVCVKGRSGRVSKDGNMETVERGNDSEVDW